MTPLLPAPEPAGSVDGATLEAALRSFRPGLGDFLGAAAAEGFWQTLAGQGMARARVREAEIMAPEAELAPLTEEEWRASPLYREGVPYRQGLTRAGARAIAEVADENAARRALLDQGNTGLGRTALAFGAAVVGSIPTPENFIPFAGPALQAARAQRYSAALADLARGVEAARAGGIGARAAAGASMGAFDALLGGALALPLVSSSRADFGDEVTWADMLQDLALGVAAGSVLGAGAGAVFGRQGAQPSAARPGEAAAQALGRAGLPPPAAQQDTALRALVAAADQVATDDSLNLALLPPDLRAEVLRLREQNRILAAQVQPESDGTLAGNVAARPAQMTGAAVPGATGRATTPGGTEVGFAYEVVELEALTPSNLRDFTENPAFPQELQPRDRTGEERQAQVRNIAARLRPEEVEASPLTTTGAPIVAPDGVVESGNGRTLAIRLAYDEGLPTAQAYRAALVRAGWADAAGMQAPILIRRRTTDMDPAARRRFVEESNADVVDALTPGEQARVDARRLGLDVLALLRSPDVLAAANADFLRAFINALPGRDQRALSVGGALTADGAQRIRRALAARAYDDPQLVARLAESADEAATPLARALMDAAPTLALLRARMEGGLVRAELDAIPALARAVRRLQDALDRDRPLRPLLDQADMFGANPVEQAWLGLLLRHPVKQDIGGVGRDTIAARIEAYARAATDAPNEPDMFGTPPPGLGATLAAAFRDAGLEVPRELRDLIADPYTPPPRAATDPPDADDMPAPPPPPEGAPRDTTPADAAARGFDAEASAELAEAQRLAQAGALPPELADELAAAEALTAKAANAEAAWGEAAACAIRG